MTSVLMQSPWLAGVAAFGLWLLWKRRRRRIAGVASAVWAVYCGYEYLMYARVLCSGECNIRVDLLLIYPVIGVLALVALVQSITPDRGSV